MTPLARLQSWYYAHCNGDWEHGQGVHIETIDNPGWRVTIPLADTDAEGRPFAAVRSDAEGGDADRWLRAWVDGQTFQIACGPECLERALSLFCDWAEA